MIVELEPVPCPHCGGIIDRGASIEEAPAPSDGDFALCSSCERLCKWVVVDERTILRKANRADVAHMSHEQRRQMTFATAMLRRFKSMS